MKKQSFISRDISWLSFNARVLQEVANSTVSLKNRINFLAIHSNNLDEFFSVRVTALKAKIKFETKNENQQAIADIQSVLNEIHAIVIQQQAEFASIWQKIQLELNKHKVFLLNQYEISSKQIDFIKQFYEQNIRSNLILL